MMKSAKKIFTVTCVFLAIMIAGDSCKKFSEINSNPNNVTPDQASPDYLMAGVLTSTAHWYDHYGSGQISGAMQETSQDAFESGFSNYEWDQQNYDWAGVYATLANNKLLLQKAEASKWDFHQGVALVMRAFNFGNIADWWGDAPDSLALNGTVGGTENLFPVFDSQQSIYERVIADLKAAITHFNGSQLDHPEITGTTISSDVFYGGDPAKWQKLAYSLLLRYYLRLSSKMDVQASVEGIAANVFQSNDDDCKMPFPGVDQNSSYQFCTKFNQPSGYHRNKMCGTMTMKMRDLKDPRIVIMAQPIVTPSVVDASKFTPGDTSNITVVIGSTRYINPAAAAAPSSHFKQFDMTTYFTDRPFGGQRSAIWNLYDTSSVYVGLPINYDFYNEFQYNINGTGTQSTSLSNYVSYLRTDIYDNPSGDLLAMHIASYSEICFDLAEAAQKGWSVGGDAATWYNAGIKASFDNWQVFDTYQSDVNNYYGCVKDYATYIAQPSVAFNGTLDRIMEQKWVAAWQACNEAYMDWRRTGLPALKIAYAAYRGAIPVRFGYNNSELQNNSTNAQVAIDKLMPSSYNATDGNNSSWSKFWLIQGTNEPW